jgi:hypothetical protein
MARNLTRARLLDLPEGCFEISKQLAQTGHGDVVPVAEALNDLLQGDAITKEQSGTTLQRCLKMLWTF